MWWGPKGRHPCRGQVRVPGSLILAGRPPSSAPQTLLGDPISLDPVLVAPPCTIRQFLSCFLEYFTLGLDGRRDSPVAPSTRACGHRWFELPMAQHPAGGLPALWPEPTHHPLCWLLSLHIHQDVHHSTGLKSGLQPPGRIWTTDLANEGLGESSHTSSRAHSFSSYSGPSFPIWPFPGLAGPCPPSLPAPSSWTSEPYSHCCPLPCLPPLPSIVHTPLSTLGLARCLRDRARRPA